MKEETDAIEFLEKYLAMKILLDIEHKTEEYGADYPDYEVITTCTQDCPACAAKAQLKKVVQLMGKNGGLHINQLDKKHFEMDWNIWLAFKKGCDD